MRLILIDSMNIFYREFHSKELRANGFPTNAIFGFLKKLFDIQNRFSGSDIVLIFDPKGGSFRKDVYKEYKANRSPMPEDLIVQLDPLKEIIQNLGFAMICEKGFEADDVIGSISSQNTTYENIVIVTGDKDMTQLVNDRVCLYDSYKKFFINEEQVFNIYKLKPTQIIDYLALIGDKSDNIPGVSGIGPKGAVRLLSQYHSLENIYNNLDYIKVHLPSLANKLILNKENAFLSYRLATIFNDIQIKTPFKKEKENVLNLNKLYTKFHFKTFLKTLNLDKFDDEHYLETKEVFDVASVYFKDNLYYIYDGLDNYKSPCLPIIKHLIAFNVKEHFQYFDKVENIDDILIMDYLLTSNANQKLESLELNYDIGESNKAKSIYLIYTQILKNKNWQNVKHLYEDLEKPLIKIIFQMEKDGVLIDKFYLQEYDEKLKKEINTIIQKIQNITGEDFNIESPKQLAGILFDKMKLPIISRTNTKQPSTAENVLIELNRRGYPIASILLEYRALSKLINTYTSKLPEYLDKDNLLHTNYNQNGTNTGRLSSNDPNLQNIPAKTEQGKNIRKAFISHPNKLLISVDYSQIELRIMAHLSCDQNMINAFLNNHDIHQTTASEIFKVPLVEVSRDLRNKAKAINFGLIYGISSFGLTRQLGISIKESEDYINLYFERYPNIKKYMEETKYFAQENGYVKTIFGRYIYTKEINNSNKIIAHSAQRAAINAPIQGSAADIIKYAMKNMATFIKDNKKLDIKMIMQVHDELIFEVEKDVAGIVKHQIKNIMENVAELKVPLLVDINEGLNWFEAH